MGVRAAIEIPLPEIIRGFVPATILTFRGTQDKIAIETGSELLRIRRAEKKTILFVTHDIDESVQLADRVVVMSTRPSSIRRIVEIDMAHPRDLSAPRYIALRDLLLGEIGLAHKI